jgi:SpoVK/Ycf46/Vps4 family AAA+-type ATPase
MESRAAASFIPNGPAQFGKTRSAGCCVLFVGPVGNGKTMAAQVLAKELQLGLYRANLGAVVSKYIGETEENLDRLWRTAVQE